MFLAKQALCSLWRHEDATESPWIQELWVAARLKSSVSSRDLRFEQSPLYFRHNLEFDAFMGSDGEIGGRCYRPLNGSLRCGGKNDDCVPCWCLWGMIQAYRGMGSRKGGKCFGGLQMVHLRLLFVPLLNLTVPNWTVLSRFQIPVQLVVQSWNKQQDWAGFETSRVGQNSLIICGTQIILHLYTNRKACHLGCNLQRLLCSFVNWPSLW